MSALEQGQQQRPLQQPSADNGRNINTDPVSDGSALSSRSSDESTIDGNQSNHLRSPGDTSTNAWLLKPNLQPGYTMWHLAAYLIASLFTISFFVFINSSQGFVLQEIVHVPVSRLGDTSGSLVFYDQMATLFVIIFWGALSDTIGRHIVYSLGYLLIGVSLILYTYATNVYPQLILLRLVFAVGGAAVSTMIAAVLADIADERDRGKIAGVVGCTTGLGALLGLFVFLRLPTFFGKTESGLRKSFTIVGCIALVLAVFLFFTLPRNTRKDQLPVDGSARPLMNPSIDQNRQSRGPTQEQQQQPRQPPPPPQPLFKVFLGNFGPVYKSAVEGVRAARDSRILLGYISSFLARGDAITVSLFMPLYVYRYFLDIGVCQGKLRGEIESCHEAYITSSILTGVTQTFALVCAPIFGFLADRIYRPLAVILAASMAAAGYILLFFFSDPRSSFHIFIAFLVGAGEIGMVTLSLTLVTSSSIPKPIRGGVAGVSSFCGAIGILVVTKLGGSLFDSWRPDAPFFVVSVSHAVVISAAIAIVMSEVAQRLDANDRRDVVGALGKLRRLEQQPTSD
ncbi:major facilitator superfamily domain-containing protein [Entophlyctis helioformis]|nr:major facilitator superfamily domain-containing protein [Entophlyctis helioformis]